MKLLVSFSGGETSAYMTQLILEHWSFLYDDIVVAFANTGQEHPETLEFVHRCDTEFGFRTVWVEAEIFPGERKALGHRIVTYETASRDGQPFEAAIAKYGIPNPKFKECTRNLKLNPLRSFARSLGWGSEGEYQTAVGIRADEMGRMSTEAAKRGLVYPLIRPWPTRKPEINAWWAAHPWRLNIKSYEGNCRWCWKKTFRKHYTLLDQTPEIYEFPRRMERQYGHVGAEMVKKEDGRLPPDYRRTFFRENKSVEDLEREYAARKAAGTFTPYHDERLVFDPTLDVGGGCEESCEVHADEDMNP